MKYAHLIKLTVFSYENENGKHISDAFLKFFSFNLDDNKIELKKTNAVGFNETKIVIIEVVLAKGYLINQFLKNISDRMDNFQKNLILSQLESRLDSNLDFFIRFDKNSWINEEKLILTDSGKCFHLKISIAAFPKKREIALNVLKNLFSTN